MTLHRVTITQRILVDVDDEDEEVQKYLKTGGSIREYVAEHYIWDETLGTYSCDIDVDQWKDLGELK
mgnify:CR=1 FL=1|tara:strand:+ start:132 stop:332 length:201 start_codon:yes stop_codon:yes gene_type:complete